MYIYIYINVYIYIYVHIQPNSCPLIYHTPHTDYTLLHHTSWSQWFNILFLPCPDIHSPAQRPSEAPPERRFANSC